MKVKITLLRPESKIPAYGRAGDAGLDLYSCEDCVVAPGERHVFKLGFAMEIPPGTVALIWDRSGMASNHGIHSHGGVIDSNFRGEVCAILHNTSQAPCHFKKGDRIAQLIIQKFEQVDFEQVDKLSASERGDKGWLSSGR